MTPIGYCGRSCRARIVIASICYRNSRVLRLLAWTRDSFWPSRIRTILPLGHECRQAETLQGSMQAMPGA